MHFVYILKCNDNNLYIGCSSNLKDRIKRHKDGHVPSTIGRLPIDLITYIAFTDKYKAFAFEKYLKSGSGRSFLQKRLI